MVSANNSSRLLLDYKAEHPEIYRQLLEYMFGKGGMGISLIKVEMGADVDSSSGTEPAVMRSANEKADVTRGAGYQFVADALEINPDIKVDMLYWGCRRGSPTPRTTMTLFTNGTNPLLTLCMIPTA